MILNFFIHHLPKYEGNEDFYNSIWGYLYVSIYTIGCLYIIIYIIWNELDDKYNIKEKIKNYREKRAKIKEHNKEQKYRQKHWRLLN